MRALIASLIIALAVGVTGCAPSDDADEEAVPITEESAPVDEEAAPATADSAPADEGSTEE